MPAVTEEWDDDVGEHGLTIGVGGHRTERDRIGVQLEITVVPG